MQIIFVKFLHKPTNKQIDIRYKKLKTYIEFDLVHFPNNSDYV